MLFFDFEVFKYDWLVVAIDPVNQKEYVVVNNKVELEKVYKQYKRDIWVGFNCRDYDQYILKGLLCGFDPKRISDFIIKEKHKGWEFSSLFHRVPINLFDVMPNPPVSLKTLEGFMGKSIHETSVPFDIDRKLTRDEIEETIKYCRFDVLNTIEVFIRRKGEFDAQMDLLKAFGLPLSNIGKTQAQLAAVILDAKKQNFNDEWNIRVPDNLQLGKYQFVADWFLDKANHRYECWVTNSRGRQKKEKVHLDCMVAGLPHTFAWGGVHGGDKVIVECADDEVIFDVDAGQLYPNIMRHYGLLSRAARKPEMLDFVLDTSMRLKAEGKKKEREPYKRQCNIFYGAEGDSTNALYDPLHRNLVCVFGQLFILDLIEKIEDIVYLFNSNTDGIFFKVKKKDVGELNRRIAIWEERTKLKMEYAEYTKFTSKDVNNYLAVKTNGEIHAKGAYVKDLNDLDYDLPIVNEALRNYLIFGTPVEITIGACMDMRKFQKIVKLSDKYKWVEHENEYGNKRYDNKSYRVFASNRKGDGRILKCDGVRNPAKFGNTSDRCFIVNDNIEGQSTNGFPQLDREWYVTLAKERLRQFGFDC